MVPADVVKFNGSKTPLEALPQCKKQEGSGGSSPPGDNRIESQAAAEGIGGKRGRTTKSGEASKVSGVWGRWLGKDMRHGQPGS